MSSKTEGSIERQSDDEPQDSKDEVDSSAVVDDFKLRLQQFQYGAGKATQPSQPSPRSKRPRIKEETDSNPSPSPKKKKRPPSKYAPPSTYAHLPPLEDILAPDLICVFVGTNPGIRTATVGHTYAHPSNMFWKLLHSSGCTDVRLRPEEDGELPRRYAMGNTNLVSRPSKDAGQLSRQEMAAGTPILEEKISRYRPEAVCIVGKGIWEGIWRWRYQREIKKGEFRWGWQDDRERMGRTSEWEGAIVFVASSTSGLSASLKPPEKEAIWRPFGEWVKMRRKERFGTEGSVDRDGKVIDRGLDRITITQAHGSTST